MILQLIFIAALIISKAILLVFYPVFILALRGASKDIEHFYSENITKICNASGLRMPKIVKIDWRDKKGGMRISISNCMVSGMFTWLTIFISIESTYHLKKEQIMSLIAHELGHYYHKHHIYSFLLSVANSLITGLICCIFLQNLWIFLVTFVIISSLIKRFIINIFLRRQELLADRFSRRFSSEKNLKKTLIDTQKENIRWGTHPNLSERI